jgi:hypothetical protein
MSRSRWWQVRSLVEELQDLHALTMKNQLGVDAETKAIMQGAP